MSMAEEDTDLDNLSPEQVAKLQKENCIFCKIISGDIPSRKVYEDPEFIGILDINPASEGHVLLLPKQHFQILPQMPPELVGNLGIACASISSKILKAFKCDGTSVFIANGAVAGQKAPHFMVHIIPRKENDGITLNPSLSEIDDKSFYSVKEMLFSTVKKQPSAPVSDDMEHDEEDEAQGVSEIKEDNYGDDESELPSSQEEEKKEADDEELFNEAMEEYLEREKQSSGENKRQTGSKKRASVKIDAKPGNKKANPPSEKGIDYDKLARMFQK